MKFNLATMGGITVITLFVSVRVCVCQLACYSTLFFKCGWIATKLEIVILICIWYFIFYVKRYEVHNYVKIVEMLNPLNTYFECIIIDFWYLKLFLWKCDAY